MTNEFEDTPDGLFWSLFGGDLPVREVEWMLNENDQGFIKYHIAADDLSGTITFFLSIALRAETDLKSDVGCLRFKFQFIWEQQTISSQESAPILMGKNE